MLVTSQGKSRLLWPGWSAVPKGYLIGHWPGLLLESSMLVYVQGIMAGVERGPNAREDDLGVTAGG